MNINNLFYDKAVKNCFILGINFQVSILPALNDGILRANPIKPYICIFTL